MNYEAGSYCNLDNYSDFENEQNLISAEASKKEELEKLAENEQREIDHRLRCISGYFLRFSWNNKKKFILSIIKNITCFDTLLRIISYVSTLYGKIAAYADVSPQCKMASQHIFIDHNRSMEEHCLKETCDDVVWITTLPSGKLVFSIMHLLHMGGGGLVTKLYIPIVNIYNRKIMEYQQLKSNNLLFHRDLSEILVETSLTDDTDQYPRDHPLTIEVEKLRKKWDETIDKYKLEILAKAKQAHQQIPKKVEVPSKTVKENKKNTKNKEAGKLKKKSEKSDADSVDWIQMLPIWIVKKIFGYLDPKTLINLKKVNNYWSYACDSLLKDAQARKLLDEAILKMMAKVNSKILKEYEENEDMCLETKTKASPCERRIKKLMNRGAVLESMRPMVKKTQQTRTCLTSFVPKEEEICDAIDKEIIFPRLIKDGLLLYKEYPCTLKDVDILIDVEDNLTKQKNILKVSLSRILSDTFSLSLSEANLQDW